MSEAAKKKEEWGEGREGEKEGEEGRERKGLGRVTLQIFNACIVGSQQDRRNQTLPAGF